MTMTRKDFIRSIVGAGVGAMGVAALAGCGGDDGGGGGGTPDSPAAAVCTSPSAAIGTNHGHTLTVSIGDVNAGVEKTYDITGTGGHAHSVTVSAAQFVTLQGRQTLMLTSTSGNAHTHTVTVTCVS